MYDFSNNTDAAQHHHDNDHGTAGSDVIPNNHNNSNSESTHDNEERNHNKPEKESTNMNRIIKNSIAPVLVGFTLSLLFTFSMASNAAGFNANTYDRDDPNNVTATADFDGDEWNDDTVACSCKYDVQLDRLTDINAFNSIDQNFARFDYNNLDGFEDVKGADALDLTFARFNMDPVRYELDRPDVDSVNEDGRTMFASFDENISVRFNDGIVIRDGDDKFVARDNTDLNTFNDIQVARANADDDVFNPDCFNGNGLNA